MFTTTLRRSPTWTRQATPSLRRLISSNHQTFEEGDIVHLRRIAGKTSSTILSQPLRPGRKIETPSGRIAHNDIIGANTRDIVSSCKGTGYCVTFPTIDEYVTNVRRLVTPVYPHDAATIVNLLDIHVDSAPNPPIEIFEAGTGHGSLTLQLCRAVHAANPPSRPRGAIIHTIDISARHSEHAEKVVSGFRRGLYRKNVDFYVGNPTQWIKNQFTKRAEEGKPPGPFLSHAILDLPGTDEYLQAMSDGLLPDGVLGVFCPSVTQIADCLKVIKKTGIPLSKEAVIEFSPHGTGVGAGLRAWNVKWTTVRAKERGKVDVEGEEVKVGAEAGDMPAESESVVDVDTEAELQPKEIPPIAEGATEDVLVCRPSVGDRLVGGGFFAVFRKRGQS
ncbi:uncharacterized protein LAJ45_02487 [Morchella importuna]|uniref:tRNA (adenine(58)-N(1))-methyltransferase catalytic subunit TRM61 n=1 Tax=Morchella conica CCBAS932 TaxID=1392247 RepID=A0A3N4KZJ0_9PEZI|nr:uncharacterized protein LAJ45_02487 [Morchella importuna]KAH8153674.1 hypothetical protein LAJ45_02487 [Morchella importuna]RPB14829.1 S-adenosyl-L-methionine-dependent methyltransferase [Morchella conica CCBAS932]